MFNGSCYHKCGEMVEARMRRRSRKQLGARRGPGKSAKSNTEDASRAVISVIKAHLLELPTQERNARLDAIHRTASRIGRSGAQSRPALRSVGSRAVSPHR